MNKNLPVISYKNKTIFTKDHSFGRIFKVIPYKDLSQITLKWYLNSSASEWEQKSSQYIGWLFGSDGPNSLPSYLMKEGLATKVSSGCGQILANSLDTLLVEIELTKKGDENYMKVLEGVFRFINALKKEGV